MSLERFRASALALGLAGMLGVLTVLPALAASSTTVVLTTADLENSKAAAMTNGKWFFYDDVTDTVNNAFGTFVVGPGSPPFGAIGSAQISTTGQQRPNLATYRFTGTKLADITTLKFSTYNPSAGNGGSADRSGYLQFNVDFNGTDTWQSRLVFVPKTNGAVLQNTWQEWDTIAGGNAMWTYSGATWPVTGGSGATPKTWNQILTDYPGVRIRVTDAFLGIRVGEPYPSGYTENIDALKLGTKSNVTTFDFEPFKQVAADKDDCKNGGWQSLTRSNGTPFKNQGDCVSYTSNGG